jgi:hypothetical protein
MKYLTNQTRHPWIGQYFKRIGKIADITETHVLIILPKHQSIWTSWPLHQPDYFQIHLTRNK